MSALYTEAAFEALVTANLAGVMTWITDNPGGSIEACAQALTLPYAVVYTCCQRGPVIVLPNAAGELHWHASRP